MVGVEQLAQRCEDSLRFSNLLDLRDAFDARDPFTSQIIGQLALDWKAVDVEKAHLLGLGDELDVARSFITELVAELLCRLHP